MSRLIENRFTWKADCDNFPAAATTASYFEKWLQSAELRDIYIHAHARAYAASHKATI